MNWIENIISKSSRIQAICDEERMLVDQLIELSESPMCENYNRGEVIAAFYDLVIAAVYYTYITNSGWLYCNSQKPKLFLPFINCCPKDALQGNFVFHKSSKPTSAKIGQATTRVLLLFYQALFTKHRKQIEVMKACEPADAIFLDRINHNVYFAEIKSSPLLTMALVTWCDQIKETTSDGNFFSPEHIATVNPKIIGNELYVMLPSKDANGNWSDKYFYLGTKKDASDDTFAYLGLLKLIEEKTFIESYLKYWIASYRVYGDKNENENIFWLTNACGKPSNLPDSWTGGVTCISDEKTSVGMDRTDDIKKGIYQVLKLGSEGKTINTKWNYKVGILSNIHPYRHYDVYLKPIKDLIWTITKENGIKFAKDLSQDTPMYNLFDGIVTFTKSYVRDSWIEDSLKIIGICDDVLFETEK